jgi:hypothetical protein
LEHISWSDKLAFTREGAFNIHNSHLWAQLNPITREWGHQVRWNINVWADIIGNCVAGPYLLPNRLSFPAYCVFLQEVLPVLLKDVPLAVRRYMWFQNDGVPTYFSAQTQQNLNTQFPDRWLGRGGPVSWPARSPDLNPMDFFLWGHLKEIAHRDPQTDMKDLTAKFYALSWPLMQTCYDVCKLVFHDVWLHVCECMVDTLNTYCSCRPLSYSVLCRQALHASQVLFMLACVNCAFFLCALFLCINSLVHECHLQFLCSY